MTRGEWISVDDRLPKVCVDVLVYANNEILIAYLSHANGWLYYENVSSEEYPVEYWMELPQPPTKGDEKEEIKGNLGKISHEIGCSEKPNNCKKFDMKGYENVVIHEGNVKGGEK